MPFVLETCFVAYENTTTILGIYEADNGYVYSDIFINEYYWVNNEQIAQRHTYVNVIKG